MSKSIAETEIAIFGINVKTITNVMKSEVNRLNAPLNMLF